MTAKDINTAQKPFYTKWSNIPFAPARFPFFYGWVIVLISTLTIICSVPGQTAGVSPFTDYLIEALGIDRQQLSVAYMIGTIVSGFILPFAGRILDKVGVRVMSVISALGLALSLLMFANVGKINKLILGDKAVLPVTVAIAAVSFFLIRFFGQGNMTMVGRVAIGKWFNHWRGVATAIAGVPIAFAFSAAPWLLNKLIEAFGWMGACFIMAIFIGGIVALLGAVLFRDNPEQCGLVMDGQKENKERQKNNHIHDVAREFTRTEAMKTASFWAFVFGLASFSLIVTAVSFNITSIGEELGKTKDEALKMFFYSSFIAIPSRFIISYLVDNTNLKLKTVLSAMGFSLFAFSLGVGWYNTFPGKISTIIGLGMATGTFGVISNVTFPRYFGRKHLGAISGVNMSAMVIASSIGPALYTSFQKVLGSYRSASVGVLVLPVVMIILAIFASNPQDKYKTE